MRESKQVGAGKDKIFVFYIPHDGICNGMALAEDGVYVAGHVSSNEFYVKKDMGITSDWKHDKYLEYYPDGYELLWLGEDPYVDGHNDFLKALDLVATNANSVKEENMPCCEIDGVGAAESSVNVKFIKMSEDDIEEELKIAYCSSANSIESWMEEVTRAVERIGTHGLNQEAVDKMEKVRILFIEAMRILDT